MKILEILDEVNSDAGKLFKLSVLEKHRENETLKQVLYLAYSPNIIFYMKQLPEINESGQDSLESALDNLSRIYNRMCTGHTAMEVLSEIMSSLSLDDAEVIRRIVSKDLRCGISANSINKVFKNLVPDVPYMGAKVFSEKNVRSLFKNDDSVIAQIKMDGRYLNLSVVNSNTDMVSRQGKNSFVPSLKLIQDAEKINDYFDKEFIRSDYKGVVLNGELMIDGIDNRYEANGIINSVIKIYEKIQANEPSEKEKVKMVKKHNISYDEVLDKIYLTVWDFIPHSLYKDTKPFIMSYEKRLSMLKSAITDTSNNSIRLIKSKVVKTYEEAMSYFKEVIAVGEEGLILKKANNIWKDGKSLQVKMKLLFTVDLKLTGYLEGNGKFKGTLGAIVAESSDGMIKISAGGHNDAMRAEIWDNKAEYMDKIVEIQCNGVSRDVDMNYSLQHPVFKGFHDKDNADNLQDILDNQDMVLGLK